MRKLSSSPGTLVRDLATLLLTASSYAVPGAGAIDFATVPSPNLDLSQLGRVAFAGNFDAISLYQFVNQSESTFSTTGSSSILGRFPNGVFTNLSDSDATINAMCPFVRDGEYQGVVVGGNFTSLGGLEAQGIALFNTTSGEVTPLPGLEGSVNALLCNDDQGGTVYVGGEFSALESTNAIALTTNFTDLNFLGFNGPVRTISQAPSGNVIFGGSFDGLGNATTPKINDQQVIPVSSANITAGPSTASTGFSDPRNIICKTAAQQGEGNTWLLANDSAGFWQAEFEFGFQPTKLRLYNTNQDGRGTKQWRFTALPINGILRFWYIDSNGNNATCDSECPLPQDNSTAQDFHFVDLVGMNSFRIDISDWYGNGGGLDGIELFQDDIYSFAVNRFNEQACDGVTAGSAGTTATGPWAETPSGQTTSVYLTANFNSSVTNIDPATTNVVFRPNITQSGNYSVMVYTPGCLQDNTCAFRGRVNITGVMESPGTASTAAQPISTELFQTNNYDKYDQVYFGFVDATDSGFQPEVTLAPSTGQSGPLIVVAQRVRFELMSNSTGGLNGLYEYNHSQAVSSDFSTSAIDSAGTDLNTAALINDIEVQDDVIYVGGNFTTSDFSNIFSIDGSDKTSLPGGGLNAQVYVMYLNDSLLYVGGDFTGTRDNSTADLNHIAVYSISDNSWQPLGAGLNGPVYHIVPVDLNITSDQPETVIAVSGAFDQILATGSNDSVTVDNFAIWVPSRSNWLPNLGVATISIYGSLVANASVPDSDPIFAGSVSSQQLGVNDVVGLTSGDNLYLQQIQTNIQASSSSSSSSSSQKRAVSSQNVTGVVTGLMYHENGLNVTIMGGHFTATASNGSEIHNLLFIDGDNSDEISGIASGIDVESTFLALGSQSTTLFAGGTITGTVNGDDVNGLVLYDLSANDFVQGQPPALEGDNVAVYAIATQPKTSAVYVGGNFNSAGSFDCPSLCVFDLDRSQWTSPGSGLSGAVSTLLWISDNELLIGGNLTVGGKTTAMAIYDAKKHTFVEATDASNIAGPVTALCAGNSDGSQYWVAGQASNGSAFLEKFDGTQWHPVGGLGDTTVIRGLQIFSLTDNHDDSDLVANGEALMVLGELNLPDFGNASAAIYNGTTFTPFLLTSSSNGPGSLSQAFVENPQNFFKSGSGRLALGYIVLIALAVALGLTFLLVVAGIVAERIRRKREGYMPAPTQMYDKNTNLNRIPPEHLFGSMGQATRTARL